LRFDVNSDSVVALAAMSTRRRIAVLVTLSTFSVLTGCGGGSSNNTTVVPPPPPPVVIPTSLNGTYVVSFSGMEVNAKTGTSTAFAMLGTLTADGKGNLTGLIDLNDLDLSSAVGATSNVQTGLAVTGTYTVGADGRATGSISFTVNGTQEQIGLDFVLISTAHGLITRFDNSGSGSGTLDLQSSATQSSFPSLAFSLSGSDANGFPLASAGAIAISPTGSVTGIQDFNENGNSTGSAGLTLASTSNLTLTNGTSGKAEFDSNFGSLSFNVWVIDSTHVKLIETDSSGTALSGDAFSQQTSFPVGQLVFTLGGFDALFNPFAAGGLMTSDANGNLNGFEDFNDSGHFTTAPNVNASCTSFVGGRCQMAFIGFSNGAMNNFEFAAYPTSGGVLLLEIDSFGLAQGAAYLQTATSFAAAQYGLNLSGDNGAEVDDIAEFTAGSVSASPNITPGMLDENDLGGTLAPATLSGAYTPAALVPGRGSVAVKSIKTANGTLNLEYYVVDSSTIAFIETDPAQVGVGSFELQNAVGALPLAQTHVTMVRPYIRPRRTNNNCGGNPAFGTCPAPAAPAQVWCASSNVASTCPVTALPVGFTTTAPAAGSWTNQFEGLDAPTILPFTTKVDKLGEEPDPNGAVGPTDSNGVGQYLEFADNWVQAYDRSTGKGIFTTNGVVAPQPIQNLFLQIPPSNANACQYPSLDGIASYDRIDNAFVLATVSDYVDTSKVSNYYLCVAVSASNGSVPASNLAGSAGQSLWNAYAFSLNAAIPTDVNGVQDFPDYLRFGTWGDGFYVSWDLEDVSNGYNIVGFEVCQLDKADIVAGLSTTPPQCYTYIPNYVVGAGTDKSLIHSILPADFEGDNPIPSDTSGEYFLALVNPRDLGTNIQCSAFPCTSNQLAFWTWSGLSNGAPPSFLTLTGHAFTPGCYNPKSPYVTTCVPEPYGTVTGGLDNGVIDGLGDRLMYRLAYRYITGTTNAEYLAVAHTVQEDATSQRTGVRYYEILAGSHPQTVFLGDIQDTTNLYFLSMPSVAMDKNGDLGITYTVTGTTTPPYGSSSNYDPSPFFVTVDSSGTLGTPVAILSNSGSSGQDETDHDWGEYVSVSADPNDDATFWAVDEFMNGNQVYVNGLNECSLKTGNGSGCTWATRIFTCKMGSGC
jgi:hypothetical protein